MDALSVIPNECLVFMHHSSWHLQANRTQWLTTSRSSRSQPETKQKPHKPFIKKSDYENTDQVQYKKDTLRCLSIKNVQRILFAENCHLKWKAQFKRETPPHIMIALQGWWIQGKWDLFLEDCDSTPGCQISFLLRSILIGPCPYYLRTHVSTAAATGKGNLVQGKKKCLRERSQTRFKTLLYFII